MQPFHGIYKRIKDLCIEYFSVFTTLATSFCFHKSEIEFSSMTFCLDCLFEGRVGKTDATDVFYVSHSQL